MESAILIRAGALCVALYVDAHASLLMSSDTPSEKNFRVGVGGPQQPGVAFTLPDQGYAIDSVTLNLRDYTSASDTPVVGFYTDVDGRPGTLVGSKLKNPFSGSNRSDDFTFFPSGTLTLNAAATYWILVSSSVGSFWWNASGSDAPTPATPFGEASFDCYKIGLNYGAVFVEDSPVPSFTIRATAVPEPATYAILGLGFLASTLWPRRKIDPDVHVPSAI